MNVGKAKSTILVLITHFVVMAALLLNLGCSSDEDQMGSDASLFVTRSSLDFNEDKTKDSFIISNRGEQDLTWEIVSDLNGLNFSETKGVNNNTIQVSVDLSEFESGSHDETVLIESNGGIASIKVNIEYSSIDTKIEQLLIDQELPSISTAIIKNEEIVWEGYYGFSNFASQITPFDQTIYGVGSISKLVTATAVMQLVEQGFLNLDEDINSYLDFEVRNPAFPDDPISTRMLLTHRSGMSWPDGEIDTDFYTPYPNQTAPELDEWIVPYLQTAGAWTDNRPGTEEQYSNPAVSLAGFVVQEIVKTDFAEYCRQNIFSVLEMTHTDFSHDHLNHGAHAIPYPYIGKYSLQQYPSGGLKTTISDFSKFLIAYLNGGVYKNKRILTQSSIDEMLTIQNHNSAFGISWYRTGIGFGHGGAIHGVSAQIEVDFNCKMAFLIFVNKSNWLLDEPGIVYADGKLNGLVSNYAKKIACQ